MDGKWFDGVQIRVKVQGQTASLSHQGNTCTVKVTNLSKCTTENELKGLFACYFSPKDCVLSAKVNQTDGDFNYAYVNFASPDDAVQAERLLDGSKIDKNIIRVRLHFSGETTVYSPLPHGDIPPSRTVSIPPVRSPLHETPTHPPTRPMSVHPVASPVPHGTPTHPPIGPMGVHPVASLMPYGTPTLPPTRPMSVHPVASLMPYGTPTLPPTRPMGVHPVASPVPRGTFSTPSLFYPVSVHPVNYPVPHGTFSTPPPTRPVNVPRVACHQSLSRFPWGYSIPTSQSLPPVKPSSVPTSSPFQLQLQKEACSSQRPAPSRAFAPTNLQSKSVKVSIHGDLTGKDIEEKFSEFGKISVKPIVHPGSPDYAYVNFQSPKEALAACELNGTMIKGTKIYVKVTEKKVGGGSSAQLHKNFFCNSLVAKLLASVKYRNQLEKISQTQQVTVKQMKSGSGFELWGDPTNVAAAENCFWLLAEKVMTEIERQSFTLPCLVVPLFQNEEKLKQVALIEERHDVEFCLIDQSTQCKLGIAEFGSKVSDAFSSTTETPVVSSFSNYMTSTTPSPAVNTEYRWLWENDKGLYTPYSPEICSKLSRAFMVLPKCQFPCKVPTKQGIIKYTIDFASMTQTNAKTGNPRNIKLQAGTPTWHYQDDHKKYVPYNSQDSAEIEKMYKSHNTSMLTINGRVYAFDFDNMEQINDTTKHTRPIRRQLVPNENSVIEPKLGLQVRGLKPNLHVAVKEFESELMADVVVRPHTLPPESDGTLQLSLLQTTSQYLVSTNITGDTFEVKGVQGYVDKVSLQVRQEMLAYKEKVLAQRSTPRALGRTVEVPRHWDPQTEKVVLKPVSSGSKEWNAISSRVRKTLPSAQVVSVERIQNQWLWEKYHFSKQRMSEKYEGIVNEKDLFHGTSSTSPEKIFKSEQGFDFRFCSRGVWGTGTYFAVNASYSNIYAYTTGAKKQMILAKVLTGETCQCNPDSSLKKPPVKSRSKLGGSRNTFEDELYDSVKGHTNGSDIFVIYDHEKAYPAYLITYIINTGFF